MSNAVQTGALTYEQMRALLEMPQYTVRDEETLRALAQRQTEPEYSAKTEAARQEYERTDLSLKQQLGALLEDAAARRAEADAGTQKALLAQQQSALGRGMQRSSYNQAAEAAISGQGLQALSQIGQALSRQQADVEAKRQQEAAQLAQTLGRLSVDRTAAVDSAAHKLKAEDEEKALQAQRMRNELVQWLASDYWLNAMGRVWNPLAGMYGRGF